MCQKLVQKLLNLVGGGGMSSKDYIGLQGGGGGLKGPEKDYVIFERSLTSRVIITGKEYGDIKAEDDPKNTDNISFNKLITT